jgi:uncharacterized protein CbrC (UPF0167 family)
MRRQLLECGGQVQHGDGLRQRVQAVRGAGRVVAGRRGAAAAPAAATPALTGALSYWTLADAAAARDFVASLPAATQTVAAASIAPQLAQRDPAATLAWAQTLAVPAAREAAVAAAYARWFDNAPAAARTWLDAANLPNEFKNRLRLPAAR